MNLRNALVPKGNNFGTFQGVFLPSILTIFGAILFLRANYVLGEAGLDASLIILSVATSITISTALSISALSTNTPVRGGGVYYLISRSLGPGFGGSIGITLFFAQTLSIPFNICGFAEALVNDVSILKPHYMAILLVSGGLIFAITLSGADIAMKFQFIVFIVLFLGIFAFMSGAFSHFSMERLIENVEPSGNSNMFILFALYFPAATGMMAGVNMSGDLKNPAKSIPLGIIAAVFVAFLTYYAQFLVCAGSFSRSDLVSKPYTVLVENSIFGLGWLVTAGVSAATISTAMGLSLCAPRVLQAFSSDKIIRAFDIFAKGEGVSNEPRRAAILTFAIAAAVLVWAGMKGVSSDNMSPVLNITAEIATMCFLFTYAMINVAAFVESFGSNPSFRPKFKLFHWSFSLYGIIACVACALLINVYASAIAMALILAIFLYLRKSELEVSFGDARRGFVYSRLRQSLIQLAALPVHSKNWRPTITVLSEGKSQHHGMLAELAVLLESGRGLVSLAKFEQESGIPKGSDREKEIAALKKHFGRATPSLFPELILCEDMENALPIFIQAQSFGPLKSNIFMIEYDKSSGADRFIRIVRTIIKSGKSVIVPMNFNNLHYVRHHSGFIDIWWRGYGNGSLMLILAYLLNRNSMWKTKKIRILRQVSEESDQEMDRKGMQALIDSARIEADVKIISENLPFSEILRKESGKSSMIFLGFKVPESDDLNEKYLNSATELSRNMPPILFVRSSGEADLMS